MASTLHLRRRITAAQNVSKTTRAMQMIAASKLKRAQDAAVSIRPYVEKLSSLTQTVAERVENKSQFPYLEERLDTKRTLLIVLSPDKGLCGGLITNLMREFLRFQDSEQKAQYLVIGKKAETQAARLKSEVIASFAFGTTLPIFDMVYPISKLVDEYYLSKQVDTVKILTTRFTSVFTQTPHVSTLLPIQLPETSEKNSSFSLFEPSVSEMLPDLLKHYIEMSLYQSLLESFVSEQAARMISMQNATDNANDIIEDLRLEYNKTRQAKITSEILDISGAKAAMR